MKGIKHYFWLFWEQVLISNNDMINTIGNIHPKSIPACRLSPLFCVICPTRLGPKAPPKSPAMASKANMAVPPVGNCLEEILMVPGHIMPTEKPHRMQPISPITGIVDNAVKR